MDISNEHLTTPDGKTYDLSRVFLAESRVFEIASVTPTKAPELLALFCRASFDLGRIIPQVYLGYLMAQKVVANRKAVLMVDVIPGKIAEKKLSQNDATRQALLDLDQEYSAALAKEYEFDAYMMFLKRRIEDIEESIHSIKKVLDETGPAYHRANYNLNNTGDLQDSNEAQSDSPKATKVGPSGLTAGKVKY